LGVEPLSSHPGAKVKDLLAPPRVVRRRTTDPAQWHDWLAAVDRVPVRGSRATRLIGWILAPSTPTAGESPTRCASAARLITGRSLARWGWLPPLLILVACALWFTVGSAQIDSSRHGVKMSDIERTVGSDLTGQLLGDLRVDSVRCVRQTETDARCVAQLFDKSGDGPVAQSVAVSIDQDTGDYFLNAGPAY
jgi:hypothetical protein